MLPVVMERRRAVVWTLIHMAATGIIGCCWPRIPRWAGCISCRCCWRPCGWAAIRLRLLWVHTQGDEGQEGKQAMTLFKSVEHLSGAGAADDLYRGSGVAHNNTIAKGGCARRT
jgi:hypothetical protein